MDINDLGIARERGAGIVAVGATTCSWPARGGDREPKET